MKTKLFALLTAPLLAAFNSQFSTALAQGTAFTYQGRLIDGGLAASGSYDLQFNLFDDVRAQQFHRRRFQRAILNESRELVPARPGHAALPLHRHQRARLTATLLPSDLAVNRRQQLI